MTLNMIYIVAFGVGLKCPRKIHLNTQCPPPFHRVQGQTKNVFRVSEKLACCIPQIYFSLSTFIGKKRNFACRLYILL